MTQIFGRTQIMADLGLKSSRVSELIKLMQKAGLVETVRGHGEGKYRFRN